MAAAAKASLEALIAAANLDVAAGLQIADVAQLRAVDPTRPLLLLCDTPDALHADALNTDALAKYPPETGALVLTRGDNAGRLGRSAISVGEIARGGLAERTDLLAVALPAVAAEEVRGDFLGLRGVIARLRDPENGCPWDLAQDHRSLRPHLLEETYEVLSALDRGDPAALREELGDLLMQVVLHAQIAQQAGEFDLDGVSESIRAKLVQRHPHVFGDAEAKTPDEVVARWDELKAAEREDDASALEGVPPTLPSLARAQSLAGRAARRGFAWPDDEALLGKLTEEVRELASVLPVAGRSAQAEEELGDLLFVIADFARRHEIDAESALRGASAKFERRFRALERSLEAAGLDMRDLDVAELIRRWEAVKGEADA